MIQVYFCLCLLVAMWTMVAVLSTNAYKTHMNKSGLEPLTFQVLTFLIIALFWPLLLAFAIGAFYKIYKKSKSKTDSHD